MSPQPWLIIQVHTADKFLHNNPKYKKTMPIVLVIQLEPCQASLQNEQSPRFSGSSSSSNGNIYLNNGEDF
jgi:hypothetical protein